MRNQNISTTALTLCVFILAGLTFGQHSSAPAPVQKTLLNKLPVLIWSEPGTKKVAVSLRIHAGSEFDRTDREGSLFLLTKVMFPDNSLFEYFQESLGGNLSVRTGFDYLQIDATADSDKLVDVLEIISSAITVPEITKVTVAEAKKSLLIAAAVQSDSPKNIADAETAARLYGDFPYGRDSNGTTETLTAIDFADLIFAKERFVTADNASLSIKGDVQVNYAYRAARRLLGNWEKSNRIIPANFSLPGRPESGQLTINTDSGVGVEQRFATEAGPRKSPDYFPVLILTHVLQSRLSGSETRRVTLNSYFLRGFLMYSQTVLNTSAGSGIGTPPALITADGETPDSDGTKSRNTLLGMLKSKVTQKEFDLAKAFVLDEFTKRPISDQWFDITTYKLTSVKSETAKLNAVTLESVQKAAVKLADGVFVDVAVVPLSSVDPASDSDPNDPS